MQDLEIRNDCGDIGADFMFRGWHFDVRMDEGDWYIEILDAHGCPENGWYAGNGLLTLKEVIVEACKEMGFEPPKRWPTEIERAA